MQKYLERGKTLTLSFKEIMFAGSIILDLVCPELEDDNLYSKKTPYQFCYVAVSVENSKSNSRKVYPMLRGVRPKDTTRVSKMFKLYNS